MVRNVARISKEKKAAIPREPAHPGRWYKERVTGEDILCLRVLNVHAANNRVRTDVEFLYLNTRINLKDGPVKTKSQIAGRDWRVAIASYDLMPEGYCPDWFHTAKDGQSITGYSVRIRDPALKRREPSKGKPKEPAKRNYREERAASIQKANDFTKDRMAQNERAKMLRDLRDSEK